MGSEMCIRDSAQAAQGQQGGEYRQKLDAVAQGAQPPGTGQADQGTVDPAGPEPDLQAAEAATACRCVAQALFVDADPPRHPDPMQDALGAALSTSGSISSGNLGQVKTLAVGLYEEFDE